MRRWRRSGSSYFLVQPPLCLPIEEARVTHLHCIGAGACGATFDLAHAVDGLPKCGELLEVVLDAPKSDAAALMTLWSERRRSFAAVDASGVWRFREALPQYAAEQAGIEREGNAPMARAQRERRSSPA